MSNPNSQVSNYVDLLVMETLVGDIGLSKTAQDTGIMSGIAGKVKDYIGNNVDPNDKAGSLLNMLAPGLISVTLGALGLGKIGMLFGLAARFFHIDVAGIFRSIWSSLKGALSGGKQVSSDQVHNIVQSAVQEHSTPATEAEAEEAGKQMDQTGSPADDGTITVAQQLRQAQILRLALDAYEQEIFYKGAAPRSRGWFADYGSRKSGTTSLLSQILSFLFRAIIASAGLMVAGDAMNHFLGRPNAIDNPIRGGKPVEQAPNAIVPTTTQTKFPLNPSYQDSVRNSSSLNWTESVPNNDSSISQMLQNFAKEVYQGLGGHESIIQSSPYFQNLVHTISWYNHEATDGELVFIPRMFTTKKQLVDQFIGDVAEKTPIAPQTGDMKTYKV
jgi:hypothetical protein